MEYYLEESDEKPIESVDEDDAPDLSDELTEKILEEQDEEEASDEEEEEEDEYDDDDEDEEDVVEESTETDGETE